MIYREHNGVEQVKIVIDEPDYKLKVGELFLLMFQNSRFWHEQEHRDRCYLFGELHFGDDIHLTTYGGGPSDDFTINADFNSAALRKSRHTSPRRQQLRKASLTGSGGTMRRMPKPRHRLQLFFPGRGGQSLLRCPRF